MHVSSHRSPYIRGIILMAGVVLPLALFGVSVLLWLNEEQSSFGQTLVNNGVALFAVFLLPAAGASLLHTRLNSRPDETRRRVWRSALSGAGLGAGLGLLGPFLLFGALSTQLWPFWLGAMCIGLCYGLLAARTLTLHASSARTSARDAA